MTKYAQGTTVPPEKSRAEIEATLRRYGVERTGFTTAPESAQVAFEIEGLRIRMRLEFPPESAFVLDGADRTRPVAARKNARLADERQRWRALLLVIKAKLEAVESEIETIERAFFPYVVLPNGATVYEEAAPRVAAAFTSGAVGPLIREDLPALGR